MSTHQSISKSTPSWPLLSVLFISPLISPLISGCESKSSSSYDCRRGVPCNPGFLCQLDERGDYECLPELSSPPVNSMGGEMSGGEASLSDTGGESNVGGDDSPEGGSDAGSEPSSRAESSGEFTQCIERCERDADCLSGFSCEESTCVFGSSRCVADSDCPGQGWSCFDGACGECQEDAECVEKLSEDRAACRAHVCVLPCTEDSHCVSSAYPVCDVASGACVCGPESCRDQPNASACVDSVCQCATDADCDTGPVDTCFEGRCGCSSATLCPETTQHPSTVWFCGDEMAPVSSGAEANAGAEESSGTEAGTEENSGAEAASGTETASGTEAASGTEMSAGTPVRDYSDFEGNVICGEGSCLLNASICCVTIDQGNRECIAGDLCPGIHKFPERCDGPEDCQSGTVCCFGGIRGATCSESCNYRQLCHFDEDCPSDQICKACQYSGGFIRTSCDLPGVLPSGAVSCDR